MAAWHETSVVAKMMGENPKQYVNLESEEEAIENSQQQISTKPNFAVKGAMWHVWLRFFLSYHLQKHPWSSP